MTLEEILAKIDFYSEEFIQDDNFSKHQTIQRITDGKGLFGYFKEEEKGQKLMEIISMQSFFKVVIKDDDENC